ncbi:hypothetical protein BGZ95_003519, partial [Linnemannia exigua]
LQDTGLKKCCIHLDGASYHSYKASSKPAGNRKAEYAEWIQRKDVKDWLAKDLDEKMGGTDDFRSFIDLILKDIAKKYADRSRWTIYDIAKKNENHIIRKTPNTASFSQLKRFASLSRTWSQASSIGRHMALSLKHLLVEHLFDILE